MTRVGYALRGAVPGIGGALAGVAFVGYCVFRVVTDTDPHEAYVGAMIPGGVGAFLLGGMAVEWLFDTLETRARRKRWNRTKTTEVGK